MFKLVQNKVPEGRVGPLLGNQARKPNICVEASSSSVFFSLFKPWSRGRNGSQSVDKVNIVIY